MLYSEQLHPGLLVNRGNSPTSVSSRAPSSTCQARITALQMHFLVLPQCICPQPRPQFHPPRHQCHRFEPHHPWLQFYFLRHCLRKTSSLLRVLISPHCLHYNRPVPQFNTCSLTRPFKYCHFLTVIPQSSAMSPPAPSALWFPQFCGNSCFPPSTGFLIPEFELLED